jgi:hypothetical protein
MKVEYEDDLTLMLLCSLPNSYTNFRDTVINSRNTLTVNEALAKLCTLTRMKKMMSLDSSSSSHFEGLYVRSRTKDKTQNMKIGTKV